LEIFKRKLKTLNNYNQQLLQSKKEEEVFRGDEPKSFVDLN
jgi:hypothetical protein